MRHVLEHALGLGLFAGVLWATGRLAVDFLGDLGRLRTTASFCLGLAWWIAGLFVLAALGFLNGWGLVALALPVALGWIWRQPARSPAVTRPRPATADLVAGGLFAVLLLFTFFRSLTPQVLFDADVYHLTLPRLYVESGGFRAVEMSVYSNWPLGAQLLYAAALLTQGFVLAKALHFGFGVLVVVVLFAACRQERPEHPAVAWLAVAFFLANGVVAFELRVAYIDLAHAFFFLSAFLFMHAALADDDPRRQRGFLLLAGICCGLTAGVKVTGIAALGVIGALYLPRLARATAGFFVLPALLLWVPWLIKAAWFTGNPAYPFLHGVFGGPDWSPALDTSFRAWQSAIGMGRDTVDYLLLPIRVILEGGRGYERFDGEIGAFWIAALPLAFLSLRRPLGRRALAAAGLSFVIWALSSQQMRFLIPILPLLALAAALGVAELADRLPRRAGISALVAAVAVILTATTYVPEAAAGYRNLHLFLRIPAAELETLAVPEHYRYIDENLPEDARLLLLNTNSGFFCPRDYLADSFYEASQITEWLAGTTHAGEVGERLAARGITHILIDGRSRPGLVYPPALIAFLRNPTRAEPLYRSVDGRYSVLEVRPRRTSLTSISLMKVNDSASLTAMSLMKVNDSASLTAMSLMKVNDSASWR